MDELLSIGEFSAQSGLSAKMLRSYAAAGLLVPAAVDQMNGYRFYLPGQRHQARSIRLLRQAGVPLADIASFLRAPLGAQLDEWNRQLQRDLAERRHALALVREHLVLEASAPETLADPGHHPGGTQMRNTFTAASATDVGLIRDRNQDALVAEDPMFAVADGLGGGGEIASLLAVEMVRAAFVADRTPDGLRRAVRVANRAVWDRASTSTALQGMGTTLAAVARLAGDQPELVVVHVGDSRVYRFRSGHLHPLTEDHSLVGQRIQAGELTEEEGRFDPQRKILTRALGVGPDVEPDLTSFDGRPGDRLLLCTDGLFNDVAEAEIGAVLGGRGEPAQAAEQLVGLAAAGGGNDNVAVVIVDLH